MIHAILNGFIEGLTEFLPVSSTGHLLILQAFLDQRQSDAFNIAIQIGPILACTWVYRSYLMDLFRNRRSAQAQSELAKIAASFLLTALCGLIAKKLGLELPDTVFPVAMAAILGACVIFWVESRQIHRSSSEQISWGAAIAVAIGQVLAMIFPGTSRSGAAVMAALIAGTSRPIAVRFSFLVGIPTLLAAGAKEIKDAADQGQLAALFTSESLVAFVTATFTAWLSVVWLLKCIQTRDFKPFAWYRIALGIVLLGLIEFGLLN